MLVRTAPQFLVAENKKGREPSGARPLAIPLGKSAKSRARSNPCWRTGDQAASRRGYAPANAHRPPRSRFRASLCNLALSARTSSLFTYAPFVGSSSFFLYANAYSNLPNESITELFNRRSHIDVAPVTATIRSPHGSVRHPEAASSSTPRRAWRIHVRPVHATSHEAARRGRRARRHTSARPALGPRKIHTRRRESPSGGDRCPARGSRTHCAAHADDDVRAAPRLLVEDAIGDLGLLCRQHAHCSSFNEIGGSDGASRPSPASAGCSGRDRAAQLDRFERVQLHEVLRVCRRSPSLSAAGRELFASSRAQKQSTNDADRLRKYLARFGLGWASLHGAAPAPSPDSVS